VRGNANVRTAPAAVADPRLRAIVSLGQTATAATSFKGRPGLYGVNAWDEPAATVTGGIAVTSSNAVAAVADPRTIDAAGHVDAQYRAGTYGVLDWHEAAGAVTGNARIDTGRFAVADPRRHPDVLPVIRSRWDCWHRPLSTLELALLQGLPATLDGAPLTLAGSSVSRWRERIGNAVPVGAARSIAASILKALLAAALGTWFLSSEGIWVRRDGRREEEWRDGAEQFVG
jgi:site-specific DNA-cytosine methylase